MAKLIGVVPAHLSSSRFPRKVLELVGGIPVLDRVWAAAAGLTWDKLVLGTPDQELANYARGRGWPVEMTSMVHTRAMDCVAEVAARLANDDDDLVVNIQSDEPLVMSDEINGLIECAQNTCAATTVMARPIGQAERHDPNAVKVVRNLRNRMLYSTREPIDTRLRIAGMFTLDAATLRAFAQMPESPLERLEGCDINRLLDAGRFVHIHVCARAVPSVDAPEDVARVENCIVHGIYDLTRARANG